MVDISQEKMDELLFGKKAKKANPFKAARKTEAPAQEPRKRFDALMVGKSDEEVCNDLYGNKDD